MIETLSHEEVDATLADLGLEWRREGDQLVKVATCKGFGGAMKFVNDVARLAEKADHHPDIDIRWDTVTLHLSSHSAGGLTRKDLDLATKIDALSPDNAL